jgi:hypothetical protein
VDPLDLKKMRFRSSIMDRDYAKKRLRYRFGELTEIQFEILYALEGKTFEDGLNRHKIYTEIKKIKKGERLNEFRLGFQKNKFGGIPSPSNFYDKFRYLEKTGLVRCSNDAYALTLKGFILASKVDYLYREDRVDSVAENTPELLPLIFTNWSRFKVFGLKKDIISLLRKSFDSIRRLPTTQFTGGAYVSGEPLLRMSEEELRLDVMEYIFRNLFFTETASLDEGEAWMKFISDTPELRKFARYVWENELIMSRLGVDFEGALEAINQRNPRIFKQAEKKQDEMRRKFRTRTRASSSLLAKLERESMDKLAGRKSAR